MNATSTDLESTIIKSFDLKSDIKLVTTAEIGYYYRSDGWFCASDVCKDLNCESVLLEKCDRLLLKVINHRYTWAFVVDLLTKEVFADFGLLCLWGLRQEYDLEIVPTVETWLADSELAALTLDSVTDISDRLLAKSIKLVNLKLDSTLNLRL